MGLGNLPLLAQTACYTISLLLASVSLIPMAMHIHNFNGNCLLYTRGTFDPNDGHLIPQWASPIFCYFTLTTAVLATVLSLVQLIRLSVMLYLATDSSFLSAFLDIVLSMIIAIMIFVSAVMVSDGFRSWCGTIEQRFPGCEEASLINIDEQDGINTIGFYLQMGSVQFCSWAGWLAWILQCVLSVRKVCIYHERENIMISMARERRILNASHKSYQEAMESETSKYPDNDRTAIMSQD